MSIQDHPTYLLLKDFLENREVCHRASAPMKEHAMVRILFFDHDASYTFRRTRSGPSLTPGAPESPDFTLRVPTAMVERLHAMETDSIGEFGVTVIGLGSGGGDPQLKMGASIHAGFWTLWRKGYFGILRLGGWQVAKVLAGKGLANIGVIREKINANVKPVE